MLNKPEFVARFAEKGYTKTASNTIVEDFIDTMMEILVEGEGVRFYGFGTFNVRDVPDKKMVDFQTKEEVIIPGHKLPTFIPGSLLRNGVKEGFLRAKE